MDQIGFENKTYINLSDNTFFLPADSAGTPYLFAIDPEYKVKYLYFISRYEGNNNIQKFIKLLQE